VRADFRRLALTVGPGALWLALFVVLPALIILAYSFMTRTDIGSVAPPVTTENYARFLGFDVLGYDPLYLQILWRSVVLAAVTTLLCILIGYPLAFYIAVQPARRKNLLLLLLIVPFWTNFLIRTYAWIVILGREGALNTALAHVGLPTLDLYPGPVAVYLGMLYGFLPFLVLPVYASVEKIDWSLVEAAADLGAPPRRAFREAVLPQTLPGLVAGVILTFIPALGTFVTPDLLGGARDALIGNVVQQQFGQSRDWPFGSAVSFLLMALVLAGLWVYARVAGRRGLEALA